MPIARLKIFISSVQSEFERVRRDLKTYLLADPFLRRFVSDVFLFEDLPATDRRADDVYLDEVERCDIYIGLFGEKYGSMDANGVSPTEHEYDCATRHRKTRLVFVWGSDESRREKKIALLIEKAGSHVVWRRITDANALNAEVYSSIIEMLDQSGALRVPPFDTATVAGATLASLSRNRIDWFLENAIRKRAFALPPDTKTKSLLTHLNLLTDSKPTNASILLFGAKPQSFHRPAETKCMLVHGAEYRRPFASYQIYGGDLFEQADHAVNFVLANIRRSVGTRAESITAPAEYELPPDAVKEAIINALVHRDYNSNASVEVRLFSDRLEVWNPGRLPGALTVESLRGDHASIPNNPLIADPMYLAGYIEKAGSGTQMMIERCRAAGLPSPDFEQRPGSVVVTLWRDWMTASTLAHLDLNDRQRTAIRYLKLNRSISNIEYQEEIGVSKRTASRDLDELAALGIIEKVGTTGKGVHYLLAKGATKGPKGPESKGAGKGPNGPGRSVKGEK